MATSETTNSTPIISIPKDTTIILQLIEITDKKTILALTKERGPIVLWEDKAYDAIGQWTEEDAINRIKEIYK